MSTEATGDGQADVVGAAAAEVVAGGPEPSDAVVAEPEGAEPAQAEPAATALTAWDTAVPSAWGAPEPTDADSAEDADSAAAADLMPSPAADDDAAPSDTGDDPAADSAPETSVSAEELAADEATQAHDAPSVNGSPDADESSRTDDAAASVEEESDEPLADEGDGDYEDDDEASENDGSLEYEEDYDDCDATEAAAPRRIRRWPRLLLALGFVVLGAAIVGGAVAIVGSVTHGFKKPVKVTYTKSALFSLKTGDCFDQHGQSYSLLPCDSPHEAEVFATFTLGGSKWPGDAVVAKQASSGCASRLTGYLNPQLAISLSQTYVYPDSVAWQAGTRTVICEVRAPSGQLTGSVRGASATAG